MRSFRRREGGFILSTHGLEPFAGGVGFLEVLIIMILISYTNTQISHGLDLGPFRTPGHFEWLLPFFNPSHRPPCLLFVVLLILRKERMSM
jgi:hypothetical protein